MNLLLVWISFFKNRETEDRVVIIPASYSKYQVLDFRNENRLL
jgi:hypothetical protein